MSTFGTIELSDFRFHLPMFTYPEADDHSPNISLKLKARHGLNHGLAGPG